MKYSPTLLFLIIISCGVDHKKFNEATWNEMDDMYYANRESMVRDLMESHLKRGMTFNEVIDLIGQPENYANMKPT